MDNEQLDALAPAVRLACDIAAGRVAADPSTPGRRVIAAHKDLNCKGRGPCWYRMVYRSGAWTYFSEERLPSGSFRAAERRASVYGDVFPGELLCSHDKGGPLDGEGWLETGEELVECPITRRRDGQIAITLPDGSELITPNPRPR